MRKLKKRFIALIVVFTSFISLIPFDLITKEAKAATASIPANATTVRLNVDGTSNPLTTRTDPNIKEQIYTTANLENAFDITVQDLQKSDSDLINDSVLAKSSVTELTKQEIVVMAINQTSLVNSDGTPNTTGQNIISNIGITITSGGVAGTNTTDGPTPVQGDTQRVGVKISGLPAGVNKITYAVKTTTKTTIFTPIKDNNGNITGGTATVDSASENTNTAYVQPVTIEHGTQYVQNTIKDMTFKAYIGNPDAFNSNDQVTQQALKENNSPPFLYSTIATPDSNMKLRYNYSVPDSLSALKYVMSFDPAVINLNSGIQLYKNGVQAAEGTDYSINGQSLTGNLENLNQPDLIVIKINSVDNTGGASTVKIAKAYSIEIRYNQLDSNVDYSMKDAGITKLNYNDDSTVKAYVGKSFTVTNNSAGFQVYSGNIYIDSRIGMISLDPTLYADKSNLAYVVTNNYTDSSGQMQQKKSQLKNGQQFIDFMAGSSNTLQLDVYKGSNGSITDSSKILARYELNVILMTENQFNMNLSFGTTGSSATYLTQPGVKANVIDFNSSRKTYDLYYGSPNVDNVTVTFNGQRSNKNEYIRVFLVSGANSSNLVEAPESVSNTSRNTSINVKVGTAQKLVVQAYYDVLQYQSDGVTVKTDSNGKPVYSSYSVGDQYIFYLPENISNSGDNNSKSNDASLSSLKINGYTLDESFSGNQLNYTVTVAKEDTTEKITAIAENQNATISATINGGTDTYTLASGEVSEFSLNSNGSTTIKIVVTAEDGTTSKTYSLLIKNNTKSSNVNLSNLVLSTGDFTFNSNVDPTKVRVDAKINVISVTPVASDSKAIVTVNGETYLDTAINVSLKGAQKTDITIVVKSEDGSNSKTYTIEVYRVDGTDWDNNNGDQYDDDQYYDEYNDTWVDTKKYEEWGTVNGKPAYFDKHNRQVKNAWVKTGGKLYYLNNLGFRASGWKVDDHTGQTYYLDPATGEMKVGWINLNNNWYYLDPNGVMHKGWLYSNGKWYYFTPNGTMILNQTMFVDDKTYTFGQDGAVIF